MALTVLVAYDITEDRRRARAAATLQRWGDRVQYSVFIVTVTPEDYDQLLAALTDIIDPDEDSILALRQCGTCWDSKVVIGQVAPPEPVLYWAAL
jgi:CRISPR-associated protein Cas2